MVDNCILVVVFFFFFPCSSGEGLALQTVHYAGEEGWAIYVAFLSIRDDGLVGDLHKNLDMACLSFFGSRHQRFHWLLLS